ncbi:MAG TPA: hypothetical protein VG982_01430, partial [Candidatus Paceibacterota bacterium]|nr:hypothetical protein [Candidatus Paceibacterota bacterium]
MKMRLIIKDATVAELLVTSGFLFPEYPLPVKFPSYEPSGTLRKSVDAPLSPLQEEFEQLLFEKPYEASLRLKKITIDTGSITFEKEDTGPWQESWLKQIKQRVSQLVPGT